MRQEQRLKGVKKLVEHDFFHDLGYGSEDTDRSLVRYRGGIIFFKDGRYRSAGHIEDLTQRLCSFVRGTAMDCTDNLRIVGIMSSGPQDLLHLMLPRRVSICETNTG